ncbi:MAG: DegV family protein [Chloroflexota bacterium]|nr:DegV family protein [Chloroflexota bacterium]
MVKIVTDSCSDITPEFAERLGITLVPLYVQFGDKFYRDNVDLATEEFYHKLEQSKAIPTTSTVTPDLFAQLFSKLAEETKEILTITLSELYSGTYRVALQAKTMVAKDCRVEVIDCRSAIGGQMLLTISATQMAQSGANLDEIVDWVMKAIPRTHVRVSFDTLEYLRKGGRIGKAQAFLGSLLRVNPVLSIKDGNTFPVARPRNRAQAMDFLVNFAKSFSHVEALAIEDATTPDELEALAERLKDIVPPERLYRSKVSPVVGTHVGPHVLAVTVLEAEP